jgi:hypothetical protein
MRLLQTRSESIELTTTITLLTLYHSYVIPRTSGRLHSEFVRLLFLQSHVPRPSYGFWFSAQNQGWSDSRQGCSFTCQLKYWWGPYHFTNTYSPWWDYRWEVHMNVNTTCEWNTHTGQCKLWMQCGSKCTYVRQLTSCPPKSLLFILPEFFNIVQELRKTKTIFFLGPDLKSRFAVFVAVARRNKQYVACSVQIKHTVLRMQCPDKTYRADQPAVGEAHLALQWRC